MTIGVLLKGANTIFRRDWPSFIFEVVTGLVMLLGLFGWMDLLLFGKWFFPIDFTNRDPVEVKPGHKEFFGDLVNRRTPSVINIMIATVFSGGSPSGDPSYALLQPLEMTSDGKSYLYPPTGGPQS